MSSASSLLLAALDASRVVIARVQVVAAAAGYSFYGYWFSHRRA